MEIKVLTLFPEMFKGPLDVSIIKNAQEKGLLTIEYINIRDFSNSKHKKVDDYPYGGGAGMVMTPQPIFDCYEKTLEKFKDSIKPRTIYCTPKGKVFNQQIALELSKEKHLVFICGHYEGVDQRVIDELVTDEISIGDYVLTGGELPVAVIIDAISRLIPGVLGQDESYQEESFYSGLLEYPHYTRPENFRGLTVPSVLLSGNHKEIANWRNQKAMEVTNKRRPDLIARMKNKKRDENNILL
ncbi:tRNA (Guanine37-N(1)-) methyltransferase [Natronincola peptidivorans]|uniref:tRNA (guanine-N(1)-)-methyltransferase n=1 Tax=Natronincola peptidivorans TaxID=426128 RepID=A0A1H9YDM8_9FIRM|nr:tRNA (guanosine(37)-N1)-methyltransferase TrmD [Natronincola peptidivorans]SES66991.1 tRNA (Guanine37-N(1)-) methyltransferase [Natronincola peptidivorans]